MAKPTAAERQAALDNIPQADLAKIRSKTEKKVKIYAEDIIEVEFIMKFGWESYWDLDPSRDRTKGINSNEMLRLLLASRKIDAQEFYKDSQASFIGVVTGNAKKPSSAFTKATAKLERAGGADV